MAEDYGVVPSSFIDPISQEIFVDPVVTIDGHTYCRAQISRWFQTYNTSPRTGLALTDKRLAPNHALRAAIEEWQERRPMALDPTRLTITAGAAVLGEGSFGRVVAGTLGTGNGRPPMVVAIKMLPALSRNEERRAFDRELRAHMHAAKHCDGVCVLHGTCELQQRMCIVMRRYDRSLADSIRVASAQVGVLPGQSGLDIAIVRRYGHSLFRTLRQLHTSGLLVQDIKPANILIDAHDEVVIADFGISEVVRTHTRIIPSSVRGTFNYMSPEAFDPESAGGLGPAADMWSMACVMVEMVTGVPPWQAMQMQQIMMTVTVRKRTPNVPENAPASHLLRRCFAYDSTERPTANDLEQALAPVVVAAAPVSLTEHITSLGAQVEWLTMEKLLALDDLRTAREECVEQRGRLESERDEALQALAESLLSPQRNNVPALSQCAHLRQLKFWTVVTFLFALFLLGFAIVSALAAPYKSICLALAAPYNARKFAAQRQDLINASQNNKTDVVEALITELMSASVNLDLQNADGWSALIWASNKGHSAVADKLISAGAKLDLQDKDGWSALIDASNKGHSAVADKLISAGAKLDLQTKDGNSGLIFASEKGYSEIADKLISAGAKLDLQNKYGMTALDYAKANGKSSIEAKLHAKGAKQRSEL